MPNDRLLPSRDYKGLRTVSKLVVDECGGSSLSSEITRGSQSRLAEATSFRDECSERFLAVDQVADMEAHCGKPLVTRYLAGLLGYDLVPRNVDKSPGGLSAVLVEAVNRNTAFVSEAARTLATKDTDTKALQRSVEAALEALQQLATELRGQ